MIAVITSKSLNCVSEMGNNFSYTGYNVNKMTKRGWIIKQGLLGNNDVDVIPIDDLRKHTPGSHCLCNPMVEVVGANLVIVHNSYDHREAVEWAEESLRL